MSGTGRFLNENLAGELALSFDVTIGMSVLPAEFQSCKHCEFPLTPAQRCPYLSAVRVWEVTKNVSET